jgi:hypothetical protein
VSLGTGDEITGFSLSLWLSDIRFIPSFQRILIAPIIKQSEGAEAEMSWAFPAVCSVKNLMGGPYSVTNLDKIPCLKSDGKKIHTFNFGKTVVKVNSIEM